MDLEWLAAYAADTWQELGIGQVNMSGPEQEKNRDMQQTQCKFYKHTEGNDQIPLRSEP